MLDSSGAALPGATVTATNVATGIETTRQTTDAGVYALTLLPEAESAGVTFVRGSDFFPAGLGLGRQSARLAFSFVGPGEIGRGLGLLGELLPAAATV